MQTFGNPRTAHRRRASKDHRGGRSEKRRTTDMESDMRIDVRTQQFQPLTDDGLDLTY